MGAKFKVGDSVRVVADCSRGIARTYLIGQEFTIGQAEGMWGGEQAWSLVPSNGYRWKESELELIPASPIRTVSRREIVPGVYGATEVGDEFVRTTVWLYGDTTADDLREAAHLFNQLAEVLEENAAADKKEAA